MRIVVRCAQIGFTVLTLGGGDPMLYQFMPDLIETASRLGLFVHVDTNGIGLECRDETAMLIRSHISLLGLPLDGPRANIHDTMRSMSSHFDLVLSRLLWLKPFMSKVKINTLISAKNAETIRDMVPLIKQVSPSRWSLYQYWPLSLGKNASVDHLVSAEDFLGIVEGIPSLLGSTQVEVNPVPVRWRTYPFVSHEGIVYIHDEVDRSAYEPLGSIFDDGVISELCKKCGGERKERLSRYV